MGDKIKNLVLTPAPHLRGKMNAEKMMWFTVLALLFPVIGSIYFFGIKALILVASCVVSSILFDILCQYLRGIKISINDGSPVVTGILVALILPPSFPVWAAIIGVGFAICIVKHIFGGLGKNIFNPALMGRAFLTAAFPVLITAYSVNYNAILKKNNIKKTDTVTSATPLSAVKFKQEKINFKNNFMNYLVGEKKGSLGETSGILIILGLIVLLCTKAADWRLPVSYFSSVFILSGVLWLISSENFIHPFLSMVVGGVLLGGTYMVTDPVTTPVTIKGKWIFGAGAGFLTVVIRNWSGYPEGVMFSILLMNAVTPIINRYTKPGIFGTK
ncbi:MAG: RnfABCDGE type electron transport complex subunit D [Elusimicrobiota bacterium]